MALELSESLQCAASPQRETLAPGGLAGKYPPGRRERYVQLGTILSVRPGARIPQGGC